MALRQAGLGASWARCIAPQGQPFRVSPAIRRPRRSCHPTAGKRAGRSSRSPPPGRGGSYRPPAPCEAGSTPCTARHVASDEPRTPSRPSRARRARPHPARRPSPPPRGDRLVPGRRSREARRIATRRAEPPRRGAERVRSRPERGPRGGCGHVRPSASVATLGHPLADVPMRGMVVRCIGDRLDGAVPAAGRNLMRVQKKRSMPHLAGAALVVIAPAGAEAKVTGFEVQSTAPAYDGRSFGEAGAYERIDAVARFRWTPHRSGPRASPTSTRLRSTRRERSSSAPRW